VLHQARKGHLPKNDPLVDFHEELLNHLETVWREPDQGVWEMRGPAQNFTHSKIMTWTAFDRAIRSAEEFSLRGPVDHWKAVRQEIHDDVCRNGFDPELGSFVQAYGSKELDASLLLIPLTGFLPARDARVVGTVKAIERRLLRNGFVLRYQTEAVDDGLPSGEGAFLACSFWLADNYILLGRHKEAEEMIERLLGLRNDLGLLAEEYDPASRRQLGNFPQAFSHVSLVNSVVRLHRHLEEIKSGKAEVGSKR